MIKNKTLYLILAGLFYLVPILIFGKTLNIYNIVGLIISTILMWFFVNYKAIESKEWPFYVVTFILGTSLSYFGLNVAQTSINNPKIGRAHV